MNWDTEKVDDHCNTDDVKQKMTTLPGRFLFLVMMTDNKEYGRVLTHEHIERVGDYLDDDGADNGDDKAMMEDRDFLKYNLNDKLKEERYMQSLTSLSTSLLNIQRLKSKKNGGLRIQSMHV